MPERAARPTPLPVPDADVWQRLLDAGLVPDVAWEDYVDVVAHLYRQLSGAGVDVVAGPLDTATFDAAVEADVLDDDTCDPLQWMAAIVPADDRFVDPATAARHRMAERAFVVLVGDWGRRHGTDVARDVERQAAHDARVLLDELAGHVEGCCEVLITVGQRHPAGRLLDCGTDALAGAVAVLDEGGWDWDAEWAELDAAGTFLDSVDDGDVYLVATLTSQRDAAGTTPRSALEAYLRWLIVAGGDVEVVDEDDDVLFDRHYPGLAPVAH